MRDPQRILFVADVEVSRVDPDDKKKRVMAKLPLRGRVHDDHFEAQFEGEGKTRVLFFAQHTPRLNFYASVHEHAHQANSMIFQNAGILNNYALAWPSHHKSSQSN